MNADDRIVHLIAAARLRREQRKQERAAFAAARAHGLRARHAAKLRRNQTNTDNPKENP